jgi:photosystem II stability/assembly factor-like uncharacterized protein
MGVVLGIGTEKGGFLLRDPGGEPRLEGPLFPGWRVTAFGVTGGGTYLAGLASNWFGVSVHRSPDLAAWEQAVEGPAHEGEGRPLEQIWTFTPAGDRVYAGVAQAGLFASDDDGVTWAPVDAFNRYPGHEQWVPGFGGLAAHRVLAAGDSLWVGVSAVGVFRSDDGGSSFVRGDDGVTNVVEDRPEPGFCVHGLAQDPADPARMWRQDHSGVYRSRDGGDHWERIEEGLPSRFGFPILRDRASGRLFVVPLESDENRLPPAGRFAAYRSDDDGDSWQVSGTGWPDAPTYTGVLRGAMDGDGEGGVFLGTTGGALWATSDAGESWRALPLSLPRILAVSVLPEP